MPGTGDALLEVGMSCVEHFSRYFHRSPDQLGPQHIREYQTALFKKWRLAPLPSQHRSPVELGYCQVARRYRPTRVLNDYGGKDFWAKTAVWFVNDGGPSGAKGFQDDAGGRVVKRYRPKFRHSDFFYEANYEKTWIPFLGGKDPDTVPTAERCPPNWKFRIVACGLILLAAVLLIAGFRYIRTRQTKNLTAEVPLEIYQGFHREYANASPSELVCTGKRIPNGVTVQVSLAGSWSEVPPETNGDWVEPCGKPPGGGDCSGRWKPYLVVRAFDVPNEVLARQLYQHPNTLSASKDYDVCVQLPMPNSGHGFAINPDDHLKFTVADSRVVSQIPK